MFLLKYFCTCDTLHELVLFVQFKNMKNTHGECYF